MALVDDMRDQNERLRTIEDKLHMSDVKKQKKWSFKLPTKVWRSTQKDDGTVACLILRANRNLDPKKGVIKDGLVWVGEQSHQFEESAVYTFKQGNKRVPTMLIPEWRMTPIGGNTEVYQQRVWNGEEQQKVAEELGIANYAQLAMVRRLEQAELDVGKKKKGFGGIIIWVIVAGVVIYIISKMFGGG